MPLASWVGDAVDVGLTVLFFALAIAILWVCIWLGSLFARISSFIKGAERSVLPVVEKVGGTVDRVNHQLDKLDEATDSAVDAVDAVDQAVRAVSFAVKAPVKKSAGLAAGLSHGFATLRRRRDWRAAKASAKEAAARREADLEEELRRARRQHPITQPVEHEPPPASPSSPPEGGIFETHGAI